MAHKTKKTKTVSEPEVIIPDGVGNATPQSSVYTYIPLPNTTDKGIYCTHADIIALLRANKDNPAAIAYIADMME